MIEYQEPELFAEFIRTSATGDKREMVSKLMRAMQGRTFTPEQVDGGYEYVIEWFLREPDGYLAGVIDLLLNKGLVMPEYLGARMKAEYPKILSKFLLLAHDSDSYVIGCLLGRQKSLIEATRPVILRESDNLNLMLSYGIGPEEAFEALNDSLLRADFNATTPREALDRVVRSFWKRALQPIPKGFAVTTRMQSLSGVVASVAFELVGRAW